MQSFPKSENHFNKIDRKRNGENGERKGERYAIYYTIQYNVGHVR